ncbi:hypothetical protein GCM10010519_73190 [Streptomyces lactacystinicus]
MNVPGAKPTDTPRSARAAAAPRPYSRCSPTALRAAPVIPSFAAVVAAVVIPFMPSIVGVRGREIDCAGTRIRGSENRTPQVVLRPLGPLPPVPTPPPLESARRGIMIR